MNKIRSTAAKALPALLAILLLCWAQGARAEGTLAAEFLPSDLKYLDADAEIIGGTYPGLLLTPHRPRKELRDKKYGSSYTTECYGYIAELGPDRLLDLRSVVTKRRGGPI